MTTTLKELRSLGPLIVTGQQAGLFGGPLYTLWKTLGAVRLARAEGARAVFWIECDDADIREADRATLSDRDGNLEVLTLGEPEDGRPVAARVVPESSREVLARAAAILPGGERAEAALSAVAQAWAPGTPWPEAFERYFSSLVTGLDVHFFNPTSPEVKEAAAPFFARVLAAADAVEQALAEGARLLDSPQVPYLAGELPMFVLDDDGRRRKLERRGDGFALKGTEVSLSLPEAEALLAREPGRFSAGVLLRPVLQDFLLPTSVYIAGPAEARYHAQLPPLYTALAVARPRVLPRPRVTLIDPRIRRGLEKLGVTLADAEAGEKALATRAVLARSPVDPEAEAERTLATLARELRELRGRLEPLDPKGLAAAFADADEKLAYHLRKLGTRARAALERGDEQATALAHKLAVLVRPGGEPQERVFVALEFLARHPSEEIVGTVMDAIDPADPARELVVNLGG